MPDTRDSVHSDSLSDGPLEIRSVPEGILLLCLLRDGLATLASYAATEKAKGAAASFDRAAKVVQQFLVQHTGEIVPSETAEGVGRVTKEQAKAMDADMAPLGAFAEKAGVKAADSPYGKRVIAEAIARTTTLYAKA